MCEGRSPGARTCPAKQATVVVESTCPASCDGDRVGTAECVYQAQEGRFIIRLELNEFEAHPLVGSITRPLFHRQP